jgi:hypothetical protein
MKQIILLTVIISIFLSSCSSSSNSEDSNNSSSFTLNGNQVNLTSATAQKSGNTIFVKAIVSNGVSLEILFNKFGNLASFRYNSVTDYFAYKYFKSNYFTFKLISLDEATKRVKISYSGKIYEDDTDLTSNSMQISGAFDLPYVVVTPTIADLGVSCKISGNNWYHTDAWDNGLQTVDSKFINDNNDVIVMNLLSRTIAPGTYNFSTSSNVKMMLGKFNTTNLSYEYYNSNGSLIITSNTILSNGIRVLEGTFTFVATNPANPSNQIQVSNGIIKTLFMN